MKNLLRYFIISILLPVSITTFAQSDNKTKENETTFGVQFGYNQHWLVQDDFDFDSKNGYMLGMFINKPYGKFIALSYVWQVQQMGYQITNTTDPNLEKVVINQNYIQIMGGIHLKPTKLIDLSAHAYVGVGNSKSQWHFNTGVEERENPNFRGVDAGAKLGATIWLKKIGLGAEYYHGMVNTDKSTGPTFVFNNRAYAVTAKFIIED